MSKRIRRFTRTIWVDSEKTAKDIEHVCLENRFVEGKRGVAYTSCHAANVGSKYNPEWAVIFHCTSDEWNRVENYYDLKRLNTRKHIFEYELRSSS